MNGRKEIKPYSEVVGCPYFAADTSLVYPGLALKHGVEEVCRHWLGGVACRLWNMRPCPTEGRRLAPPAMGQGEANRKAPLSTA